MKFVTGFVGFALVMTAAGPLLAEVEPLVAPAPAAIDSPTGPAAAGVPEPAAAPSTPAPPSAEPLAATPSERARPEAPPTEATAAPAMDEPPPLPLPPPEPTLLLSADLGAQRVVVTEHAVVKHTWPISSGTSGYRTPTGTFRPTWTDRMHYSRQWDWAPMPYAVFFNRGVAFHATYATGRLGRPASHGCVRLSPANARALYNLVHKHGLKLTKVVVHGAPKFKEPAVASRRTRRARSYAYYDSYYDNPPPRARRSGSRRYSYSDPYYSRPGRPRARGSYGSPFGSPWD